MRWRCRSGIAAAVFTSEFAPRRLREVLKPTIELLAGIPSVVLGFFALMVMATWLQDAFGFTYRLNAVVAGLGPRPHGGPGHLHGERGRARRGAAQLPRGVARARRDALGDGVQGGAPRRRAGRARRGGARVRPLHRRDDDRAHGLRQRGDRPPGASATRSARSPPPSPPRWARWCSAAPTTRCCSSSASSCSSSPSCSTRSPPRSCSGSCAGCPGRRRAMSRRRAPRKRALGGARLCTASLTGAGRAARRGDAGRDPLDVVRGRRGRSSAGSSSPPRRPRA